MPSPSHTIRRLEDLPSDGGRAVDTLAGANLRIFIKLSELEEQLKALTRRVANLEVAGEPAKPQATGLFNSPGRSGPKKNGA